MPRIDPIQEAFTAGEISPRLWGRTSLDLYKNGLGKCENFLVYPHGGVTKRGGFHYVAGVKDSTKTTILQKFNYKDEYQYVFEFGHNYIRVFRNQAAVMDGASPYEVVTTYIESEVRDLRFTQDEEKLFIVHKDHPPAELIRTDHDDWTLQNIAFSNNGVLTVDNIVFEVVETQRWTLRTSAADNYWMSICWSPELSLFCAVARSGVTNRVMTSSDGIIWKAQTSVVDNAWSSVCWSPELNLFVAVAYSGVGNRVMTSADGINWTSRSSSSDKLWFSVCWSPELDLFVAVAFYLLSVSNAGVMTSPDGINWTDRTPAVTTSTFTAVCWSPELTLFVAVASSGATNGVMTSPDGITWTGRTAANSNQWWSVCWSPELNLFVAVAITGSSNRVMTSSDGITWVSRTSPNDNEWTSVCWSPEASLFVAVSTTGLGNRVMTSPDGITWTLDTSAADNEWQSVCWSPELSLFCAVSSSGSFNRVMTKYIGFLDGTYDDVKLRYYAEEEEEDETDSWSSDDCNEGRDAKATVVVVDGDIDSITITENGAMYDIDEVLCIRLVDIGGTSDDWVICDVATLTVNDVPDEWGDGWTLRTSAADNDWQSVCWSPELNLFVVVAATGTGDRVMTSPDGITWTIRTSAVDDNWNSVCWSPELTLFVAVAPSSTGNGATNGVMTSPDGITWTVRTAAVNNDWRSVCWSPELNLFVAVAATGTGNRVMTSSDGITWVSRLSAANNWWYSVCWSPELQLFCAVSGGTGDRVMTSPDGITWTLRTSVAENSWRSVCWSPELTLFVAVAHSGTGNGVMTSPDGFTWTVRTAANNDWRSVCWSPELSLLVAVAASGTGNRVMTSPDGFTWTLRTSAADNNWQSVCWSPELQLFCAVAYSGTGDRVMTSPDGILNHPTIIWFFEQRLWLAATPNEPNQIWGSRSADYFNFYLGEGLDDEGIAITIKSANKLLWAIDGSTAIILGAHNGEFKLASNSLNDALTPSNIRPVQITNYGNAFIPVVQIDADILFVQKGLRTVRRLHYEYTTNSYVATPVSITSEHITESGIVDIAYSNEPNSIFWAIRTDGVLVAMTYEPGHKIFGWHRHPIGGEYARVKSIINIDGTVDVAKDELWAIIERTINGSTVKYIEFLVPEGLSLEDDSEDAFFVDSGITKTGSAFTTFDGLDHLEGEEVRILADGAVQAPKTVSGGEVTLDIAADKAHAGLAYAASIETLPLEGGNPIGTAQAKIKRVSSLVLRLYRSLTFYLGDVFGNEDVYPFGPPEEMGSATPLFTGDTEEQAFPGGYDTQGRIRIASYDPLPLTVLSIMYELRVKD